MIFSNDIYIYININKFTIYIQYILYNLVFIKSTRYFVISNNINNNNSLSFIKRIYDSLFTIK